MKTYVAAEFETADFADLALGRVNSISGNSEVHVLHNRISNNFGNNDSFVPYYPVINPLYNMMYSSPAIYGPKFIRSGRRHGLAENYRNEKIEPSWRDDRLLEVAVNSDSEARRVSEILINAGGHNVRTIQK